MDWLVVSSFEVPNNLLVELAGVQHRLHDLAGKQFHETFTPSEEAEQIKLESKLRTMLVMHRWPLTSVGLGTGVSGQAHIQACWLHAVHIECADRLSIRWNLAVSVGACGDLGTESGLGKAVDPDITYVFKSGEGPNARL